MASSSALRETLHQHRPDRARMGADVSADLLSQSQQVAAQRAGVGIDRDLAGALDECGQHEFGLGRPSAVDRRLACARRRGHRVDGQPVVAVFLEQLQRHREQLSLPRRPRRLRATIGTPDHGASTEPVDMCQTVPRQSAARREPVVQALTGGVSDRTRGGGMIPIPASLAAAALAVLVAPHCLRGSQRFPNTCATQTGAVR